MDEKTSENKRHCWHCRRELTDKNSWMPTAGFDRGAPTFYCVGCQNAYFVNLSRIVGSDLAYFYCCVKFDVPYVPSALKESKKYEIERGPWGGYITALRAAKWHQVNDRWAGFKEGETNIRRAISELKDLDADTPEMETSRAARTLEDNQAFWGGRAGSEEYDEEDYITLNSVWDAMTEGRGAVSSQSRLAIQDIARWTLERDKLMAAKEFDDAKKVDAMIEKLKESEQLRKKDELPQDRARLDDIVKAVERAGLNMMDYDELCRQLSTYMFHSRYGYTRDAADQMILLIRNATAFNEGIPEVDRLPDEFAIVDALGEFAEEPDEKESQTYRDLGIAPLHMKGGDANGKTITS